MQSKIVILIQTHSTTPISHINNIKMFRRCRDLPKNKKTSITNFTQEKSQLPKCPAFFIHFNIFLDCPSSYLITLGPLNSWLAKNVSWTLMLNNGLVNTVGVNLIHRPIIRLTFSGRRITLFAPARLVDSWSSQAVEFSAAITRCSRVHIQIVTVWGSMMGDIFSSPFIVLSIFVKFLSFQDVTPTFWRVTLSFQRVILLSRESWYSNFHHTTGESTCDTLSSSAANQGW